MRFPDRPGAPRQTFLSGQDGDKHSAEAAFCSGGGNGEVGCCKQALSEEEARAAGALDDTGEHGAQISPFGAQKLEEWEFTGGGNKVLDVSAALRAKSSASHS